MPREVRNDFIVLKGFIESYSLAVKLDDNCFVDLLSQYHKKYYAYLTIIGELQNNSDNDELVNLSKEQILFLSESCSDIGTSFFNLFHGAYKSSKLILRSSIETFIKGFTKDEYENIMQESSLYVIFREVKELSFFQSSESKTILNNIHRIYKELCADVHTAQPINMENVSALNHFPMFSKHDLTKLTQVSTQLICNYVTLICMKYNDFYHTIHYINIEIIKNGIERRYRPLINNIK